MSEDAPTTIQDGECPRWGTLLRMEHLISRRWWIVPTATITAILGCTSPGSRTPDAHPTVDLSGANRDLAFELARDTLRDMGYRLDRVDAAMGVLTSQPRSSGGLPTTSKPLHEALHEQDRVVRIEFDGDVARVECAVRRTRTPSLRLSTRAIGLSNTTYDPLAAQSGTASRFTDPVTRDDSEAARIAGEIARRMSGPGTP